METAAIVSSVIGGLFLLISLITCLMFMVRRRRRGATRNEYRDFSPYGNQTDVADKARYGYNQSRELGGNFVSRQQVSRYNASPYGVNVGQELPDLDVKNFYKGNFASNGQMAPVPWQTAAFVPSSNNPYTLGNTAFPQNLTTSYMPGYVQNVIQKNGKKNKKKNKGYSGSSSESDDDNIVVPRKWFSKKNKNDTSSSSSDSEDEMYKRKSKKKMKNNKGMNRIAMFETPAQALTTPQTVFQPQQQTISQPQVLNVSNLPNVRQLPSIQTQQKPPSAYVINIPNQEEQQETSISYEVQPVVEQYRITGPSVFTPHQNTVPKPYEDQIKSVNIDGGCGNNGGVIVTGGNAVGNLYTTTAGYDFNNQGFDTVDNSNRFQNNGNHVFGGIMTRHSTQPFQTYTPFLPQKPLFFQGP